MVGLGVMGRNLLLNIADHGFPAAGYDKEQAQIDALNKESGERDIRGAANVQEFCGLLRKPRAVMILVPAGPAVDSVIRDLTPHLEEGDLIIDAGNSYFKDTNLRAQSLADKGIHFLGVGVSGGEEGARHGPSMMPGGPREAYERVRPVLEAVAAKVDGNPCVAYLGPGSAGHFVKMVHNGIEYALMQLLAESYDLMKRGLGMTNDELSDTYAQWNEGELSGYLIDITSRIFDKTDTMTGKRLVDEVLDVAKQKGTGMWTSQSAMELHTPTPTIDLAVSMRDMSVLEEQRETAGRIFERTVPAFNGDRTSFLEQLREALYAGMILSYAQGISLLTTASDAYDYGLDLETVARIWRGGCIIRAALLEDIRKAYRNQPGLSNPLLAPELSAKVAAAQDALRAVVRTAVDLELPAPAFMASLGYLDAYRSAWLPANLIQAQRDCFGSHTYERVDRKGTFHSDWTS